MASVDTSAYNGLEKYEDGSLKIETHTELLLDNPIDRELTIDLSATEWNRREICRVLHEQQRIHSIRALKAAAEMDEAKSYIHDHFARDLDWMKHQLLNHESVSALLKYWARVVATLKDYVGHMRAEFDTGYGAELLECAKELERLCNLADADRLFERSYATVTGI